MLNNFQIIENGYNTSYIVSLITALFYKSDNSNKLLDVEPKNKKFVYIQEFIKIKFNTSIQKGFCIYSEIINEFRNYINYCGWQENIDDMLKEHDVADFYSYIMNGMYGSNMFIFEKINNNNHNNCIDINYNGNFNNEEFRTSIIDIPISSSNRNETEFHELEINNLSNLFKSWINRHITMNKEYSYKMAKYFNILPIRIRRQYNCNTKINIMKYIKLFDISDAVQSNLIWKIQSIICYKKSTGYYSIILDQENWVMISDKMIPSIKKIDMTSKQDVDDISENVVMVFYKYHK